MKFFKITFSLLLLFIFISCSTAKGNDKKIKNNLVLYKGEVHHLFFHPLISNTKKAFKRKNFIIPQFWFVTVDEYKKILQSLYDRNFVLVDIHDTYETKKIDKKTVYKLKKLYLPKGKKALSISVDDVNYYKVQKKIGTINKLVFDSDGNIAGLEKKGNGKTIVSKENNIVSITENFIKKHPDFSHNGARPILALTGYEGALGYRTDKLKDKNYEKNKMVVLKLVKKLKDMGWDFASHSYGHIWISKKSLKRLKIDTAKWKKEVESLVGKTELFIYPYGVEARKERFNILYKNGFRVFFGVRNTTQFYVRDNSIYAGRVPVDGRYLKGLLAGSKRNPYFLGKKVLDSSRNWLN